MHAIKKYQYELAILVILLLQFVYEFLASVYPYIFVNYIADYSLGFGPRKLIGSLCRAVLPSGYGELHVVAFITFWYAILMGLATYMMSGFIRNGIGRGKNICFFAIFFVTLYLLSPMRPEYLFVHTNFGRMDAYMLIFALCFILLQGVEDKCFFLLSTILMSLSCLAHQIFVCTFLPLYCGLYVYRIYKSPVRI